MSRRISNDSYCKDMDIQAEVLNTASAVEKSSLNMGLLIGSYLIFLGGENEKIFTDHANAYHCGKYESLRWWSD